MLQRNKNSDRFGCQISAALEQSLKLTPKEPKDNERLILESINLHQQPTSCTLRPTVTDMDGSTAVQSPHCATQPLETKKHTMSLFSADEECLDELAVRASFVFITENIIFESFQDELMEKGLLLDREREDYVCRIPSKHFKAERLIKLMIRKKTCKDFVEILSKMSCHQHVYEKIQQNKIQRTKEASHQDKACNIDAVPRRQNVTDALLQKHFIFFYNELEPHTIADEMFQEGHISVCEHDAITEFNTKYKRVKELFKVLKQKPESYSFFSKYIAVLRTPEKREMLQSKNSGCALCLQQNFILLQDELSGSEDGIPMTEHMYEFLDEIDLSDIQNQFSVRRQKCKLLKILMMKGEQPCRQFLKVFDEDLEREDLIREMRKRSKYLKERGKPILESRLTHLDISCLQEYDEILRAELDPLDVCDLLLEERAVGFLEHDKVTEARRRQKQMDRLLDILKKNENDCFHFFLFCLQKEEYSSVLSELSSSAEETKRNDSNENFLCGISHSIMKVPGAFDVQNGPIEVRLSMADSPQVEQAFLNNFHAKQTGIVEEAITHGQINIDDVTSGSVVLQLRPLTDQAVQSLLNARENNNLLDMIIGMLKQINVYEHMDGAESLEIKVQVCNVSPQNPKTKSNATKAELIKQLIKANRNKLLSELEPGVLISALSNSKFFPQETIEEMKSALGCRQKIAKILEFVVTGGSTVVEGFFTTLKDVGYCDIANLIDPTYLHNKAEITRTKITSNYKTILEEMQITLARETLSNCIGDVAAAKECILPKNGKHKQRMHEFLQFILLEDHNVIQFENMLKHNGLEELLELNENKEGESRVIQDIEVKTVEHPSLEGVLFESVITLFFTHTKRMEELEKMREKEESLYSCDYDKKRMEELEYKKKEEKISYPSDYGEPSPYLPLYPGISFSDEDKMRMKLEEHHKMRMELEEHRKRLSSIGESFWSLLPNTETVFCSDSSSGHSDVEDVDFCPIEKTIIIKPDMSQITHISLLTSDAMWVSDGWSLKQVDKTGNVIKTLDDKYKYDSYCGTHAVSKDGDLVFLAWDPDSILCKSSGRRCGVYKMTSDGSITNIFTTDPYPQCLHSSYINGDILIGIRKSPYWGGKALVLRIGKTGEKIQDIELRNRRERLYDRPIYITENRINGDILVSDEGKRALVVVYSSGRHRFDYTGQKTDQEFQPIAVCVNLQGHILLAHRSRFDSSRNDYVYCVSRLDQNGMFLTRLQTEPDNAFDVCQALGVDDKNEIYVSSGLKIKVFRNSSVYNLATISRNKLTHPFSLTASGLNKSRARGFSPKTMHIGRANPTTDLPMPANENPQPQTSQ